MNDCPFRLVRGQPTVLSFLQQDTLFLYINLVFDSDAAFG
jgi:hypothetical protein